MEADWRQAARRACALARALAPTHQPTHPTYPLHVLLLQLKVHLAAGDGVCDLGVAGIGLSTENLERGLTFTLPTLR